MRPRSLFLLAAAGLATWGVLRAQRPFQEFATQEGHAEYSLPPDYQDKTEWTRARLRYNSIMAPHGYPDGYALIASSSKASAA